MSKGITKEEVIDIFSARLKLVRVEQGISQEKMADLLGLSKKTLVQIEKGRVKAGWTLCIAAAALFFESEVLQSVFGGSPLEVVRVLADLDIASRSGKSVFGPREKTLGGRVWWTTEQKRGDFRLQRNLISGHYRILDNDDLRWISSFDREALLGLMEELVSGQKVPG